MKCVTGSQWEVSPGEAEAMNKMLVLIPLVLSMKRIRNYHRHQLVQCRMPRQRGKYWEKDCASEMCTNRVLDAMVEESLRGRNLVLYAKQNKLKLGASPSGCGKCGSG